MDHVIHVPMTAKKNIGFVTDTLKLGLQHEGILLVVHAHESEIDGLSAIAVEHNVLLLPHREKSITTIRYHIKNVGDRMFPGFVNWQWDDDIKCFRESGHWDNNGSRLELKLPYRDIKDPREIVAYLDYLYERARSEKCAMFGPTSTFRFSVRRVRPLNRFSHFCKITSIVGFLPGTPNPYPNDPNMISMEETYAVLEYRKLYQKREGKAALRDNGMTYISRPGTVFDPKDPARKYAINKLIDRFGEKPVKFLHRSMWMSLLED
ncbi:MAG: hypothetical protein KAJ55_02170 [Anaerolineales bacterium]|nr:hypothetical protein [Anaerolineales bacterium]